jgi:hypothetical protein
MSKPDQARGSRIEFGTTEDPSTMQYSGQALTPALSRKRERVKRAPRWTVAFLRALERTGKVRWAAEDAGVDFSTAYARRKVHAGFAAEWTAALQRFRAAKDGAREAELEEVMGRVRKKKKAPPPHFVRSPSPRNRGEDELVIRASASGAKLVKASAGRWSKAKEEALLVEMGATGSVRLACKAIGLSENAVSKRRRKDRHLDAACAAAVEIGRARLNGFLVDHGNRTFDPDALPLREEDGSMPRMSVAEAIQIAKMGGTGAASAAAPEVEAYDVKAVRERLEKKMCVLGLLHERERSADAVRCADCGKRIGEEAPPRPRIRSGVVPLPPPALNRRPLHRSSCGPPPVQKQGRICGG